MLIDFEDCKPAPRLSLGDKAFVAFAILGSGLAIVGLAGTLFRSIADMARSIGLLG